MKKQIIVTSLFALSFVTPVGADDAADVKTTIENHYKLFHEGKSEESAKRFHLDDFTLYLSDGGPLYESDFNQAAERMGATVLIPPYNVHMTNFKTQIYDDVAVVTFFLRGTIGKKPVINRVSAVWVKSGGNWKEAHHHETQLSPNRKH